MIQKICPVCDQVMKAPHYCRNCRSWVKEPQVRDVTYFLNERHPQGEAECSYHQDGMVRSARRENQASQKSAGQTKYAQSNKRTNRSSAGKQASGRKTAAKKQKMESRGFRPVFLIVFITMTIILATMVFVFVTVSSHMNTVYDSLIGDSGYDVDLGDYMEQAVPEAWNQDYEELTDDAVKAAGIGCSSEAHFDVNGPELADPLVSILESLGYEVAGTNIYSYNEKRDDGETWFATWMSLDLTNEPDGSYRYVELDYDTADERLHQISLELGQEPGAAEVAAEVLVLLEEKGAITGATGCGEAVLEPLLQAIERGEDYSLEYGNLWVMGNAWEDEYGIVIQPLPE